MPVFRFAIEPEVIANDTEFGLASHFYATWPGGRSRRLSELEYAAWSGTGTPA